MSKTGYIYKLVSNDINITELYVGSTQNFRTRKNNHKCKCNNENDKGYNLYVYQFIRDNGGWYSFSMVQIEEFKFNTRNELNARERFWIESLQATLNKLMPSRTREEHYKNNKTKIKDINSEYYKNNKTKIKDKIKAYKELNKELIKTKRNKRGRELYKINKEKNIKFYNEFLEYIQS